MLAAYIQNIEKSYGAVQALKGMSLEVDEGEVFGLIGPDGAGKTTLIRILTSLIYPDSGEAMVLGLDPVKDYEALRRRLGYMPGKFSLYQDLTVEENLSLFAHLFETTIEENYDLIRDIYSQIEPFKDRKAGALSGGMKQKLALSCAMIHKPDILFLDEPTTGVDPVSRKEFWEILKRLNQEGLTIIVSTPYMDEANRCDRIALIQDGRLMAIDSPDQISGRFKKDLFSIKGPEKYQLVRYLKSINTEATVFSFGAEIHFATPKGTMSGNDLENLLIEEGHKEISVDQIKPGIEDTFMELMSQHGEQ